MNLRPYRADAQSFTSYLLSLISWLEVGEEAGLDDDANAEL
jgi:hypothetical protein